MRIRGLVGIALIALLAGCGGAAVAAQQQPAPTVEPTSAPPIDVEAIARDEIAALDKLGYPTELVTWEFSAEYTNTAGGTATTRGDDRGFSVVTMSADPTGYTQFSTDVEMAIRSTIRHELGHALTYWLFPQGAEAPLSRICLSTSPSSLRENSPAGECAAEAASIIMSEQRHATDRVAFYGLDISPESLDAMRPIVSGSLTWVIPAA